MSDNTTLGNAESEIILPEVEINLFTPKNPTTATIAENSICTDDSSPNVIRHITIDPVSYTHLTLPTICSV